MNNTKSFLDRDMNYLSKIGVVFHPSISVNQKTFRGDLKDPNHLFKAVCSILEKRPPECKKLNFVDQNEEYQKYKELVKKMKNAEFTDEM